MPEKNTILNEGICMFDGDFKIYNFYSVDGYDLYLGASLLSIKYKIGKSFSKDSIKKLLLPSI